MPRYKDPRKALSGFVIALALFIFVLSGSWSWHAYTKFRDAQHMLEAVALGDKIIRASGLQAVERGMTAAALGMSRPASTNIRERIAELRRQSEALWTDSHAAVLNLAQQLPGRTLLMTKIARADQAHEALDAARAQADVHMATGASSLDAAAWLGAVSEFIANCVRVREVAMVSVVMSWETAQLNHSLKQLVLLAGEHAGRERGTLAYYVSAGQPIPPEQLDSLKSDRGIVLRNLNEIRTFKNQPDQDPRLVAAIDAAEAAFLNDYETLRTTVYREAHSGDYSITGEEWVHRSTEAIDAVLAVAETASQLSNEVTQRRIDGARLQLLLSIGMVLATVALVALNLAKVRQIANELFHGKELAEVTLHSIGDAVITTDAQACVEYINPVAEQLTGWKTAEARGRPLREIFHIVNRHTRQVEPNPIDKCLLEQRVVGLSNETILLRRHEGEIHIEDSAAPIRDRKGNIVGAVLVFYDVSATVRTPHLLSYHASHDPLTRLINRREFERRLTELLVRAKNSNEHHALCFIDIDQFKIVNDTCGHAAGDQLLGQIAYLLHSKIRDIDTLARLGGDEFGLLLEGCGLDQATRIADVLRQTIKEFRFSWHGKSFELGASIGLVPVTSDSVSPSELMSEADTACYAAKENGRDSVQIYEPGNIELAKRHGEMHWVSRISQALQDNRFQLYCQPIVALKDAPQPHCEVQLRMQDLEGNLIPPMTFIPAAERFNLMPEVDRWVVRNTFTTLADYLARHEGQQILCNINVSGASIAKDDFRAFVMQELAAHRLPARSICFEITETTAVTNFERAIEFIRALREAGCRFALDDFGSGLSSFAYLKNLPVDYLKIDGNLIQGIADDPVSFGMVQAIHRVSRLMGLQTIAEYVTSNEILGKLKEIDVDFAQGFAVGEPRPLLKALAGHPPAGAALH